MSATAMSNPKSFSCTEQRDAGLTGFTRQIRSAVRRFGLHEASYHRLGCDDAFNGIWPVQASVLTRQLCDAYFSRVR
jgi:hypothetical protein